MMGMEFKITKRAMDFLKANYTLLRVDGVIKGLCHDDDLSKATRQLCSDTNNFDEHFGRNIGFTIKLSAQKIRQHFSGCVYGSKNKDKVHVGMTTCAPNNDGGRIKGIPDERIVLMTKEEGVEFKQEAKNHEVLLPNNRYVESNNPEMRRIIPKAKLVVPDTSNFSMARYNEEQEAIIAEFLVKNGVPVTDIG